MTKLGKYIRRFEDVAIRLDQSYKDGKKIMSTTSMSIICTDIADTLKEVENLLKSK